MIIIHSFAHRSLRKEAKECPKALLTNRNGSYYLWEHCQASRYGGFFWYDAQKRKMFKIIEQISINNLNCNKLINNIYAIRKEGEQGSVWASMPSFSQSLVYALEESKEMGLFLDVKESYDNREWGRNYSIWEEKGCVVVEFVKKTDSRDDPSDGQEEYRLYLAISGHDSFQKRMEWVQREYSADKERNSPPFSRHVYKALSLRAKRVVFSVAQSKQAAIKEAQSILKRYPALLKREERSLHALAAQKEVAKVLSSGKIDEGAKAAFFSALASLDRLVVHQKGIRSLFAGLPWFFQFWPRDSLVSLRALEIIHPRIAREIAQGYCSAMRKDGRIKNVSSIESADATGWLMLRMMDEKRADKVFKSAAVKAALGLLASHTEDGFDVVGGKETWMDSLQERGGKCIEMQALRLAIYRSAYGATGNEKYKRAEDQLRKGVKERFWNGKILADRIDEWTIRPNAFIAAYAYPNLLSKKEWEICFEDMLPKLWLSWGGLSTIDTSHQNFQKEHTGEDPKSYHSGDSWFWINSLAALILFRTNPVRFKKYISKVLLASSNEILWMGAIGHHAELSSSSKVMSQGCLSQAWSSAMFAELVSEMAK